MKILVGEFKETGIKEIDINVVVSHWNDLWVLTERRKKNLWTLTKQVRKDSPLLKLRFTISADQGKELIKRLDLKAAKSSIFKEVYSWKVLSTKNNLKMGQKK